MYTECLVYDFFRELKTNLLPNYEYLTEDLWSPNVDYESRLLSYIVKQDIKQSLTSKQWIGFVWTMGQLEKGDRLGRPYVAQSKNLSTLLGEKYWVNFNKVNINVGAFSNEIHKALEYMEMFSIALDRSITIQLNYPEPIKSIVGPIEQQIDNITMNEFSKLERESRGSLALFSFSFSAIIPMFLLRETSNLIGTENTPDGVKPKIYLNFEEEIRNGDDDNDGDSELLQQYYETLSPGFIII